MLTRRSAAWRVVAPALALVQFAAVTFVPVAHPFLHYRPAPDAAESRHCLAAPAHDTQSVGDRDQCPACLASAGITAPPTGAPEACPRTWQSSPGGGSDRDLPRRPGGPANRVRAPPLP
jgi:hypothetical protein